MNTCQTSQIIPISWTAFPLCLRTASKLSPHKSQNHTQKSINITITHQNRMAGSTNNSGVPLITQPSEQFLLASTGSAVRLTEGLVTNIVVLQVAHSTSPAQTSDKPVISASNHHTLQTQCSDHWMPCWLCK